MRETCLDSSPEESLTVPGAFAAKPSGAVIPFWDYCGPDGSVVRAWASAGTAGWAVWRPEWPVLRAWLRPVPR